MTPETDARSLTELLRDLARDASALVRQELNLARTEAENKVHQSIAALVGLFAGALLGFAGLIILLDALVYGLTEAGLDHWLASLIVGGVVALIGYILVRKGQNDLSATRLTPERSAASFRKDVDLLREQVSVINDTDEIDRIELELAATRARLDGTLDALQQKLSPGGLVSQATTYFKEGSGMDLSHNIGRSLREHPVPVALAGLALGWLLMAGSRRGGADADAPRQTDAGTYGRRDFRSDAYRYTSPGRVPEVAAHRSLGMQVDLAARAHEAAAGIERAADEDEASFSDRVADAKGAILGVSRDVGEAAASFRDRVEAALAAASDGVRKAGRDALSRAGEAGASAADFAGDLADRGEAGMRNLYGYGRSVAQGVRDGADDAVHQAQDLGSRTATYLQEQPLLLGALGVTVGAVLGMLLPSSRYEREMLGGVREGLRDTAFDAVRRRPRPRGARRRDRRGHCAGGGASPGYRRSGALEPCGCRAWSGRRCRRPRAWRCRGDGCRGP